MSVNFVLVIPIYENFSFSEDAVALYIIQLKSQFMSSGHLDGCLQLHVFVAALMMFLFCILSG